MKVLEHPTVDGSPEKALGRAAEKVATLRAESKPVYAIIVIGEDLGDPNLFHSAIRDIDIHVASATLNWWSARRMGDSFESYEEHPVPQSDPVPDPPVSDDPSARYEPTLIAKGLPLVELCSDCPPPGFSPKDRCPSCPRTDGSASSSIPDPDRRF